MCVNASFGLQLELLTMAIQDWLWLVRLVIEILGLIAKLPEDDLKAIAKLRQIDEKVVA